MAARSRRARLAGVHELAMRMPPGTILRGSRGNPIYQVGGKSFVFFRTPRPDAVDPVTGERYPDVIVFWVPSESDKQALVQDPGSPFFTTPHFDGHPSVLVRGGRIGELTVQELTEVIQDAWLAQDSRARATPCPVRWRAGRSWWWKPTPPDRRLRAGRRACSSRFRRTSCEPASPGAASPRHW